MPTFLRVRDKHTNHEFDIEVTRLEMNVDDFEVIDKKPVDEPRPPKHFDAGKAKADTKAPRDEAEETYVPLGKPSN